jgi:SAM-dependent methyltransferase
VADWEPEAERWIRWARTPGFDAYWYFRDAVFDAVVPAPGARTLEIGCGEGRVTRDLAARGHTVVALDAAGTLVRAAAAVDPTSTYGVADVAALPFPAGVFDVVVAYNALQVVADLSGTVAEAARVLRRGGSLSACVVHPVTDLGHLLDNDPEAPFLLRPDYFQRLRVEDTVSREGLTMTFRGWTHSLEDYVCALERAGLRVATMREPRPAEAPARYDLWRRVPLFLALRAVKP